MKCCTHTPRDSGFVPQPRARAGSDVRLVCMRNIVGKGFVAEKVHFAAGIPLSALLLLCLILLKAPLQGRTYLGGSPGLASARGRGSVAAVILLTAVYPLHTLGRSAWGCPSVQSQQCMWEGA